MKYVFYADHKHYGSFNAVSKPGTLKINPFGRQLTLRDTQEIASTIIHEYMHFRGFNEFTAHWVQFKFMMRVMAKKPAVAFPSYAAKLQAFQTVMNVGGPKQASRWMVHYIVDKGYNLAHYGGSRKSFIRGVSNYRGGRYKEIDAVLKTGFFPAEFIPKTLRGS